MENNLADSADLIKRALAGNREALNTVLDNYRVRLEIPRELFFRPRA